MNDGIQAASRDLVFDISGHMMTLLRFLIALGSVEAVNRIFGLEQILANAVGLLTPLIYTAAFIVTAGFLITSTDRVFADHLARLQSFISRSLPINKTTQDGYHSIAGKIGLIKGVKRSTKFSSFYTFSIFTVVFIILRLHDGFSVKTDGLFQMLLHMTIGVFSVVTLVLIAGSLVTGQLTSGRRNTSEGP